MGPLVPIRLPLCLFAFSAGVAWGGGALGALWGGGGRDRPWGLSSIGINQDITAAPAVCSHLGADAPPPVRRASRTSKCHAGPPDYAIMQAT